MNIINKLKDKFQGKCPQGKERSDKWPAVRAEYLKKFPKCAVCGGTEKIEVHHKRAFHTHPQLELVQSNLISLCESKKNGVNCHLLVGHLGNFKSINATVDSDARQWSHKLATRPS